MVVLQVSPGQDIGEMIHSSLQRRENIPKNLKKKTCWGVILSAIGDVLSPEVQGQGSSVSADGEQTILKLHGTYKIPKDGDVHIHGGLHGSFTRSPEGPCVGGSVVGPLVAASVVQVVVLISRAEE